VPGPDEEPVFLASVRELPESAGKPQDALNHPAGFAGVDPGFDAHAERVGHRHSIA
jgi:hypothetical protein